MNTNLNTYPPNIDSAIDITVKKPDRGTYSQYEHQILTGCNESLIPALWIDSSGSCPECFINIYNRVVGGVRLQQTRLKVLKDLWPQAIVPPPSFKTGPNQG
eukprot:2806261-Amphidinium_carterae.1